MDSCSGNTSLKLVTCCNDLSVPNTARFSKNLACLDLHERLEHMEKLREEKELAKNNNVFNLTKVKLLQRFAHYWVKSSYGGETSVQN